ncbi:DUF3784 domain-containing protein [Bariatricus sp. SGI.154]|uniref:DUF3784 domain-containing protein n=1 Tax=Bariatricus sp. SGI.154 TaxID=3420549 RepID=UPI003D00D167
MLIILSLILLSGHGSWFISGYNTASKKEKEKYNERKLCQVTGGGLGIIAVLALIMCIFENQLPTDFIYVFLVIIFIDIAVTMILSHTICKK